MVRRSMPRWLLAGSLVASGLAAVTASISCGTSGTSSTSSGGGTVDTGSGTGSVGSGFNPGDQGPFADFPKDPIVETGLPAGLPGLFAGATGSDSGGPCLAEPAMDAMIPRNWTPLLFEWSPPAGQNVFELRLSVKGQTNDLLVYTTKPTFTIDAAIWKALTLHSPGKDIQVTLRGATLTGDTLTQGPATGASGAVHISPTDAPGSVVYWTSSGGTSFQGFSIGDAKPVTVLTPAAAGVASTGGQTKCVSCHTSSPDGKLVIYTRDASDGTRSIDARRLDGKGAPDAEAISPSALALLGRHKQGAPVLSAAHYSATDAVAISSFVSPTFTADRYELTWIDLHAADDKGWGVLARTGDPRQAASPAFRHDGTAIAYVSAPNVGEAVVANVTDTDKTMDIYTVPYNDRKGGEAKPVPGASDPAYREYYPVYSPGDTLLAFNRTDQPVDSYNQPSAELAVVPALGGTAVRLRANDPPACTGKKSPGLTNSWARWAPSAGVVDGRKYYWLVFSSKRRSASIDDKGKLLPQLYISAIVTSVTATGETIETEYPALYVTSQIPTESNHTPAWDIFEVNNVPK
jgi:hypothetical protein